MDEARRRRLIARLHRTVQEWADDEVRALIPGGEASVMLTPDGVVEIAMPTSGASQLDEDDTWERATVEVFT